MREVSQLRREFPQDIFHAVSKVVSVQCPGPAVQSSLSGKALGNVLTPFKPVKLLGVGI